MAVGSNVPVFGDICRPGVRATSRPTRCSRATSTGTTTATARAARSRIPTTRCCWRRCSTTAAAAAFVMGWAHFADIGGLRAGLDQPRHHRHLPGRHHHPADQADRRRRHQRGGAGDLPPQFALPDQSRGDMRALMASVDARREAHRGDRWRASAPTSWPTRCASSLARTRTLVRDAGSPRPSHYGTHRFTDAHRFRRPRQRPVRICASR